MRRIAKGEGVGNILIEEAAVPVAGAGQVVVRNRRTLISRGSEIGRRYLDPGALDAAIMGYSSAGVVASVGEGVTEFVIGQPVALLAPHAEYVVSDVGGDDGRIVAIPDGVSFDQATFHPLVTGAVVWAEIAGVRAGDTVAILGQGLVGNLVLQAVRAYAPGRIIAVDALPARCAQAREMGADVVIDAATEDPVAAVLDMTGGRGADVVIDCVGGKAGVRSFMQAQEICRPLGRIHLIALYHGEPLPLDAGKIQRRLLIGGYFTDAPRAPSAARAMAAIRDGTIRVAPLITHHFPFTEAKAAFDLLYERPDTAFGVVLTWDRSEERQ
ncbi:MAG: zinc-dependent alcohol dehydrogenase [Thermomicrobiales bacterium]